MNRLRELFFKGLVSNKPTASYLDKNFLFYCNYSYSNINIRTMSFIYEEYTKSNFLKTSYSYRLIHDFGEVISLTSLIKYEEREINIMFEDLILAQKKFLQTRNEIENNLNEFKLGIEI